MNRYKMRGIVEFLQAEVARLNVPLDADADVDGLMVCFGLREALTREEFAVIRREMLDFAEAQAFLDVLRMKAST